MVQRIKNLVNVQKEALITFTQEIIRIPSFSGKEQTVLARIQKEMNEIGFDEIYIDDFGNLIGRLGSGKHKIAFDAHVDTVELGEKEDWFFEPLSAKLVNGVIYGRGAADQKGGLASALFACKIIKELGIPKNISIYFVASIMEEPYEGLQWQFLLNEEKLSPDIVILTEPSNLEISLGHRGRIDLKITVKGTSSHGAEPDLGDNAIYKIAPIILDIEKLHQELPEDLIFGKGTITVTDVRSTAVSLNAVADSASIHLDRRLGMNDTLESVLKEIRSLESVKEASADVFVPDYSVKSYKGKSYKIRGYYPTWLMEQSHPLVQTAIKAFVHEFNLVPELRTWRFSTNGVATKGLHNIPTIGFGPGEERYAHTSEDQVSVDHLLKATRYYTSLVFAWAAEKINDEKGPEKKKKSKKKDKKKNKK